MKKKIISLLLIGVCGCGLLVGCDCDNKDEVNTSNVDNSNSNRFIEIGDKYYLGNTPFEVYCDSKTNIVYLEHCYYGVQCGTVGITVLYNSEGKPMTVDEYNKNK